jgi:lactate dehydrogenase-like 2-hydroxyacid dehydrogenase
LALVFNQSKWLEYSLFPYAVILQVTPVIAIAPLLLIYLSQQTAVIVCAWIVGFFPVLSNTTLGLSNRGIRLPPQHCQNVRRVAVAVGRRDCHLRAAGANLAFGVAALARERPWKGQLMVAGNISSEKIDLLIYGPSKPIVDNGFSDQFVLHSFETNHDLDRLTPAVAGKIRGAAVTYNSVRGDGTTLARFPKLEIVSSFGVGYDHIDANYAHEHNIIVTNTPDVLTEEVADIAMGLLIATLREFIKADRYLRSGLWLTQQFPLSVGSLRDRKVGMVGMGRIGQAIGRRLDASRVPVAYHSRNPAAGVSYKHYPDLIEMAKAVDTLILILPGGASTAKMINADVMKALGPRGVIINVARGSVVDEPALIAALKSGTILAAGLDVFASEPTVPDELRAMQNVVLLPHIGSASVVTRNAMDQLVVDNLKAWFAGKPPLTPVAETPAKGR